MLKDSPEYIPALVHEASGVTFYMPAEITNYHKSRELAMQAQNMYSLCGISKEVLSSFADKLLELANKQNNTDTLKTDIGVIANNLKARMKHPVDEQCAIKMGAIACFIEGEEPEKVNEVYTQRKLALADKYPDIYAFFFDMGVAFTPEYSVVWRGLQAQDYLAMRSQLLNTLTPQSIHKIS